MAKEREEILPEDPGPDLTGYHQSWTEELRAIKNRVRNLVHHNLTSGEHKEVALRTLLRRHLPESVFVGRGFIVTPEKSSTQIDILIVKRSWPTLFKDGDLVMVAPGAVCALIEVKTQLEGPQAIREAAEKITRNAMLCMSPNHRSRPWTGLFDFDTDNVNHETALTALSAAYRSTQAVAHCPINGVSLGRNQFFRLWDDDVVVDGNAGEPVRLVPHWKSYQLENLAPSYFIGNMLESCTPNDAAAATGRLWFPIRGGKEPYGRFRLNVGGENPAAI